MRAATIILAGVLAAFPLAAAEEAGIRPGRLELYPTFECLGLRLDYSGDSDSNATAAVRYRREGDSRWQEAQALWRVPGGRLAGSIFFLSPGSAYEVQVTLRDQGTAAGETVLTGRARTRSDRFPIGGGREYYVDPLGDDSGPGSALRPFRTIGRAGEELRPGDMVRVRPGVYREQVTLRRSGQPEAMIAFLAEGGGVVLSGADPRYDTACADSLWREEGGGVYSTDPGCRPRYLAAEGVRLYHYESRAEFDEFICGAPGGWFQEPDSGRLYLRLSSGADPGRIPVQLARRQAGFHLRNADHVLIEGFEIRDYGAGEEAGSGVHFDSSAWCVVRDCSIHGMQSPIRLSGARSEGDLIERCELWDTSIPRWPWAMTKGHDEEGGGVLSQGGRGNVVRWCRMYGLFDGLAPSYWDRLEDEAYNCDWDVYGNEIRDIRDDIIEPEGPCINFRFWNNRCSELFVGVSLAPINVGPFYVMYNAISRLTFKNLKYSGSPPGVCCIYHNTFWSDQVPHTLVSLSRPFVNQVYRNNIFVATGYALDSSRPLGPSNDLDYDDWFSLDLEWFHTYTGLKRPRLFRVAGQELPTIAAVRERLGWERHGLSADPRLLDPAGGDLRLGPDSPCLDRGQRMPNINDFFVGEGPDLGAYERGLDHGSLLPLGGRP